MACVTSACSQCTNRVSLMIHAIHVEAGQWKNIIIAMLEILNNQGCFGQCVPYLCLQYKMYTT